MNTISKVSRSSLVNILAAIRQSGDRITNEYDELEVLAASSALNIEMRGFRPDSTTGRKDAAQAYLRKLPRDKDAAARQLKTDAAAALGEPEILSEYEEEIAVRKVRDDAQADLERIASGPMNRKINEIRRAQVSEAQGKLDAAWSRNWDQEIIAAKAGLERNYDLYALNPDDRNALQLVHNSQTALISLRQLKEVAEERASRA